MYFDQSMRKKVSRPPKNRRKQPHEVMGKFGPKMSKHGTVILALIVEQKGITEVVAS